MTERNPTVVVTSEETLPDVLQRLRGAASGGRTVHLVVPIDSSLLLTASEFRSLKDILDEQRLSVVMRTSDPLRLRLGERLGVPIQAMARPKATAIAATLPDQSSAKPLRTEFRKVDEDFKPFVDDLSAPIPDPTSHWPGQNGQDDDASLAVPNVELDEGAAAEATRGNPPSRWLPAAAILAVIVLATFFLIRFVVPRAVVHVSLKSAPVTATLVFDITSDGQPLDDRAAFALSPTTRQLDVVWEGSALASGVRIEPDGVAAGPLELRNASSDVATVDAGTIVTTETGVEFAIEEAVTVPAVDPTTGKPGAATGSIRAAEPGSGGNVDTGEIGGRLPNGIYYSNRMQPAAGGTDKEFSVVTQADLDKLSAAAREGSDELAAAALAERENVSEMIVSGVEIAAQRDEFDHQVHDDAETVSLRSTLTVDTIAIDESAAAAEFEPQLVALLAKEAPPGFAVKADDIVIDPPREIEERDGGIRLEISARVDAVAELDEAERNALAARLAGANADDVAAILAEFPDIVEFTIDNQPGWFTDRMPSNATRIEVEMTK